MEDKEIVQEALNRLRFSASRAEAIQERFKSAGGDADVKQAMIAIDNLISDLAYSEGLAIEAECALERLAGK